jgi:arginine repressor
MDRKPNISEVEVLSTSTALIQANGETTTLEVKNKLREDGYWAKQAEVSQHMQKLFNDGKLHSTNDMSRTHQVYTMPQPESQPDNVSFWRGIAMYFGGRNRRS